MEGRAKGVPWKDIFLGLAVISFFSLAPGRIPVAGNILGLLTPAVILLLFARLGWRYGLAVNTLALLLANVFWPSFIAGIVFLVLGIILFQSLEKGFSITRTVGYGTGFLVLFFLAISILFWIQTAQNPYQAVVSAIEETFNYSIRFYSRMDVPSSTAEIMQSFLRDIRDIITRYWTGIAAASLLTIVWLNVWIVYHILHRYKMGGFRFGDLSRWSLPENLVWLVVFAGTLSAMPYDFSRFIGINLFIFLAMAYFFQGLSIASFYMKKYHFPGFVRFLLYLLIYIQTYLLGLVAIVGLFDLWADFRRIKEVETS